jgi:hypothetical protein
MSKNQKQKENYKYKFVHNIKSIVIKINNLFDFLKNAKMSELVSDSELTIYERFKSWCVDVFTYGLILSLIYNWFIGFQGLHNLYLWLILGLSRWVVFDSIKTFKEL